MKMERPWKQTVTVLAVLVLILGLAMPAHAQAPLEMQVYVKEPASQAPPVDSPAKYEPACGALLGATIDKDTRLNGNYDNIANVYGRPYSAILVYVEWWQPLPVPVTPFAKNNNLALQVSWEPSDGLEAVSDDSYTEGMAQALSDYGSPVFLRFGGEMNGDWTAWGQQPELYKEKFRLISNLMKQMAPNVAMVWSPNFEPDSDPVTFQDDLDEYYPGDDYVDWVGINGYADYYQHGDADNDSDLPGMAWVMTKFHQGRHANPLLKYEKIYDEYSSRKPIMLSETGVAWYNNNYPPMDVTAWGVNTLERLYGYLPLMYPRIKAIFYFNAAMPGDCSRYSLYDNDAMFQAYKQAISTPYFLDQWQSSSPFCYIPLTAPSSEICELATNINDEDGQVAEVEYYLDGRLVGWSHSIPWTVTCRFPSGDGQISLEVYARDAQGNVIATTSQGIDVPGWQPIKVEMNGRPIPFDIPPANSYGRVMAPVSDLGAALGIQVSWDDSSRMVSLNDNEGKNMTIQVDNQVFDENGSQVDTPEPGAEILHDRAMLPLRFVAGYFGFQIDWGSDGTVNLTK